MAQEENAPPFQNTPLPENAPATVRNLILSYLVYHCYEDTAKIFSEAISFGGGNGGSGGSWSDGGKDKKLKSPKKKALESSLDSMDMDVDDVATVQRSLPLHDGNMPAMVKTMECRKKLVELVSQGELEQAIHLCHQNFPGVIVDVFHPDFVKTHQMNHAQKKSPFRSDTPATSSKLSLSPGGATDPLAMAFQLHCQHFIELVRKDLQPEALQYAQTVLSKFGLVDTKFLEILRDVVALIAYQNPATSPVGVFLSQDQRFSVAEALNAAILVHMRLPPHTALENLVRQVIVVRDTLASETSGKDKKTLGKLLRRWKVEDLLQSEG